LRPGGVVAARDGLRYGCPAGGHLSLPFRFVQGDDDEPHRERKMSIPMSAQNRPKNVRLTLTNILIGP
jgi:hypothetical protein